MVQGSVSHGRPPVPCLYGTSFGALESIMATLLKFYHCGRFQFCTLQTVPKLAAESRLLVEANAIHRSLKTARLDENYVVAGSLGYYTFIGLIRPCSCHLVPCYGFPGNREPCSTVRFALAKLLINTQHLFISVVH